MRSECPPVDAPEGTDAFAKVPSESPTSASTVGFPLESIISLPIIVSIFISIYMPSRIEIL